MLINRKAVKGFVLETAKNKDARTQTEWTCVSKGTLDFIEEKVKTLIRKHTDPSLLPRVGKTIKFTN
tara:strand:+ start:5786 stop:5986 length:201 start_codon:yes stop_codon:yes gene_type:complete